MIVSSDKLVDGAVAAGPARAARVRRGAPPCAGSSTAALRDAPPSPDGGLIADYHGAIGDAAALAARLEATPGVVDHGLFPPELVSEILIARGSNVERIVLPMAEDEAAR